MNIYLESISYYLENKYNIVLLYDTLDMMYYRFSKDYFNTDCIKPTPQRLDDFVRVYRLTDKIWAY